MTRFLQGGISLDYYKIRVAWRKVSRLTNESGLNIKRLANWNKTAILKHLWHLITNKAENL